MSHLTKNLKYKNTIPCDKCKRIPDHLIRIEVGYDILE